LEDTKQENFDLSHIEKKPNNLNKLQSDPMPITNQQKRSKMGSNKMRQKKKKKENQNKNSLNSLIRDDHFDEVHDEDINDKMAPIEFRNNDNELSDRRPYTLQRTRSKSMGSFTETMDIATKQKKNKNINMNKADIEYEHKSIHNITISTDLATSPIYNDTNISSPIYKELSSINKKLTICSFGPSRRPTHGNIHCVIKVETNDFKGQCCIALDYDDFAKKVENEQCAELFYHGVPLYDKTGSPIQCKIRYKCSLIDKQIVFNYD